LEQKTHVFKNNPNITNTPEISRYRPEIDGFRAFAVIAVIINHFNKNFLPGGYLGVDIFFVISGYIITSSLCKRPSKDFKSFISEFYKRRIKRLVPALSVFAVIASIAICLFNPTPEFSLRTGIRSLFGLSNLYLLEKTTDYFAQSTQLNIFTHTWSLSVEEQFYILFPFLVWFSGFGRQIKNGARNLFLAVSILATASLVSFLYLYSTNQSAAYFLMPSRFWEIAVGCLAFIGFQKRVAIEKLLERVPPFLVIALIIGVMYMPMSFASISTLVVVGLSSMLIACLKNNTTIFRVFTHQKVVFIGLISYSLYLWHWGVLSVSRWTIGIHWWSVPLQVALMFGLAVASYRWIETPLRKGTWFGKQWKALVVGGGALVVVSDDLFSLEKFLKANLYLGDRSYLSDLANNYSHFQCNIFKNTKDALLISDSCGSNAIKGASTIYALGDSHVSQFANAISYFASNFNYNYLIIWGNSCPFPATANINRNADRSDCQKNQIQVEQKLMQKINVGDIVFVANSLFARFNPKWSSRARYRDANGQDISMQDAAVLFSERFLDFAKKINKKGGKVVFYTSGIQFPGLKVPGTLCRDEWFRYPGSMPSECFFRITSHIQEIDSNFLWRKKWTNGFNRFVFDAYLYAENCDTRGLCTAGNYIDSNHFNAGYSFRVFNEFIKDNPNLFIQP